MTPQPGRPPNSLHLIVGEISGKLDTLLVTMVPRFVAIEGRLDRAEAAIATFVPRSELASSDTRLVERVGALEALKWQAVGVLTVGGAGITVWEFLPHILHYVRTFK